MGSPFAITAVGLVSAAGDNPDALFSRMLEARSLAVSRSSIPVAPIEGFVPSNYVQRKGLKHLSRTSQLACAAASTVERELQSVDNTEIGVVLGTAWASLDTVVRFEREAYVEGPRFVDPVLFTETVANVPAGQLSIFYGWSALNATIAAGSSSGTEALRRATEFLQEERARVVVAGGVDELNAHLLGALQLDGPGPVGGEGACLFAIESESSAASRGATVLGRLAAAASLSSGADGIRRLFDRAGVGPSDVDLVVLSSGAGGDDGGEAALLVDVFGSAMPPAVAPKAVLGETWGGAGALAVATALQSMARRVVPPSPESTVADGRAAGLNLLAAAESREVACSLVLDGAGPQRSSAVLLTT